VSLLANFIYNEAQCVQKYLRLIDIWRLTAQTQTDCSKPATSVQSPSTADSSMTGQATVAVIDERRRDQIHPMAKYD